MKLMVFLCFLLLVPGLVLAHSDHSHDEIQEAQVKERSLIIVKKLVKAERLDESWLSATVKRAVKKEFKESTEWVVSLVNKNARDDAKSTLYIFLGLKGEYLGANYTGK